MAREPTFEVTTDPAAETGSRLVVAPSAPGMAGITAADYLVTQAEAPRSGNVSVRGLPSVAPFSDGEPRPHTRLYDLPEHDLSVLVGELFVPVWAADAFADGLLSWAGDAGVEELAVLSGIPYPHGPDEHDVYAVATPEFRERRVAGSGVGPLGGGFLDGVGGELLTRSVEGAAPPTGVVVTPAHPPGPDLDAALLFADACRELYGLDVTLDDLEELSSEVKRRYEELAKRMESLADGGGVGSRDYSEDRAYM